MGNRRKFNKFEFNEDQRILIGLGYKLLEEAIKSQQDKENVEHWSDELQCLTRKLGLEDIIKD